MVGGWGCVSAKGTATAREWLNKFPLYCAVNCLQMNWKCNKCRISSFDDDWNVFFVFVHPLALFNQLHCQCGPEFLKYGCQITAFSRDKMCHNGYGSGAYWWPVLPPPPQQLTSNSYCLLPSRACAGECGCVCLSANSWNHLGNYLRKIHTKAIVVGLLANW